MRVETAAAPPLGVLGLGIAGNQLLGGALTNPAALARFDRDVLGMAGLTHVIMADGINDFGSTVSNPSLPPNPEDVEYGLRQLVSRAHARGVKVIGTTMGPAFGSHYENSIPSGSRTTNGSAPWAHDPRLDLNSTIRVTCCRSI